MNARDPHGCPKRRKKNELQFAAASVKADLARAGIVFPEMNKNSENTRLLGDDVNISLKGVRLMHSNYIRNPLISSNVSAQCSAFDYAALAIACRESYPDHCSQVKHLEKSFTASPATQDSNTSTSSVSDSASESADCNGNAANRPLIISPLVEDCLESGKRKRAAYGGAETCHVVACAANAVTMGEMLQLSKKARLVASSCSPFTIVHANAAFIRFSGIPADKILGSPFSSLLDAETNNQSSSLRDCMLSSSTGHHKKLMLRAEPSAKKVESVFKVSPIVARKTETSEVATATHFAVECTDPNGFHQESIQRTLTGRELAVGVMG